MSNSPNLAGKTAVVTGGGSGIGRATVLLLARHGAKVHVADIRLEAAEEVALEVRGAGGSAVAHALDVSDPDAVEAFADGVCGGELTVSRRIVNDREACGAARRPMTALIP